MVGFMFVMKLLLTILVCIPSIYLLSIIFSKLSNDISESNQQSVHENDDTRVSKKNRKRISDRTLATNRSSEDYINGSNSRSRTNNMSRNYGELRNYDTPRKYSAENTGTRKRTSYSDYRDDKR